MTAGPREVVAILLAAGRGRRFGADKRWAEVQGDRSAQPLAVASARNLLDAGLPVTAVVRPEDDDLARVLEAAGVRVVRCAEADRGMGSSLAFGIGAEPATIGWLVALADMPWIRPGTVAAVASLLRGGGATVVAPAYRGRRGHPVGFAARFRAELLACTGDAGARPMLEAHRDEVRLLDVDDPGVVRDVDAPGDLSAPQR